MQEHLRNKIGHSSGFYVRPQGTGASVNEKSTRGPIDALFLGTLGQLLEEASGLWAVIIVADGLAWVWGLSGWRLIALMLEQPRGRVLAAGSYSSLLSSPRTERGGNSETGHQPPESPLIAECRSA